MLVLLCWAVPSWRPLPGQPNRMKVQHHIYSWLLSPLATLPSSQGLLFRAECDPHRRRPCAASGCSVAARRPMFKESAECVDLASGLAQMRRVFCCHTLKHPHVPETSMTFDECLHLRVDGCRSEMSKSTTWPFILEEPENRVGLIHGLIVLRMCLPGSSSRPTSSEFRC